MKIKNISDKLINLRGTDFPVGVAVEVDDATAKKCLDTGAFEVAKEPRKAKSNGKNKD